MLFFCVRTSLSKPATEQKEGDLVMSDLLNTFAFNFQQKICEGEEGNVVFSPFSVYSGLAMLHLGAANETKNQIAKVLEWKDVGNNNQTFLGAWEDLTNRLKTQNGSGVTVSSAVNGWLSQDFNVLKGFREKMKNYFGVEFEQENFQQPETARININKWVSEHTGKRINALFPSGAIDSMTRIVLANAIYLKGLWTSPFKKTHTSSKPFYTVQSSGSDTNTVKKVPFMYQSGEFLCGAYQNIQLLQLPYGNQGEFTMLLARPLNPSEVWSQVEPNPADFTDIMSLSKQMNPALMKEFLKSMIKIKADIYVPRFTLKQKLDLRVQLDKLGIKNVFGQGIADLSPINGKRNLYISSALHKAFIQVNEEGTEAGAATGLGISLLSMPPQIQFNRPFLFYILQKPQNAVIFAGRVVDPSV